MMIVDRFRALIARDGVASAPYDLASLLRARGFEVLEAAGPSEGWDLARDVHLLVAELASFESANLGLLRRVRMIHPRAGLVAMAGDYDVAAAARRAGAHVAMRWSVAPELVADTAHRLAAEPLRPAL